MKMEINTGHSISLHINNVNGEEECASKINVLNKEITPSIMTSLPTIPLMVLSERGNSLKQINYRKQPKREYSHLEHEVTSDKFLSDGSDCISLTETIQEHCPWLAIERNVKLEEESNTLNEKFYWKEISCPLRGWHRNGVVCTCPMCELSAYIVYLYRNQRQASKHVMLARPSPCFAYSNGLPPTPPQLPVPRKMEVCPVFEAFGFCPYSVACYLSHDVQNSIVANEMNCNIISNDAETYQEQINVKTNAENCKYRVSYDNNDEVGNHNSSDDEFSDTNTKESNPCELTAMYTECKMPLIPRATCAEEELRRLCRKASSHLDAELWVCEICGYDQIDETCLMPVGERVYYRHCPRCLCACYYPEITYLVSHIIESAADDYEFCKHEIDRFRAALPDEFKIPFTFEAHKVANIIFSWSLLRPCDARDAIDVAHYYLPQMTSIVSMGSGSGYVEHIFNRVTNNNVKDWYGFHRRHLDTISSFDNVHVSFYGTKTIDIFAFDELALRTSYSVHVSFGNPLSLLSIDCTKAVLLLSWPPFGSAHEEQSSMGFEALEYYTQGGGTVLIYVGDVGSTGDWRFHEMLYTHYKLVREYPVRREIPRWCPQDMGLVYAGSDTIGVYRRRLHPVQTPPS